jgi:tRNA pseudouridine38-40 synthase
MQLTRYKLTIAYRGTAYHGFQKQATPPNWVGKLPAAGMGIPTVQQTLEQAVAEVVKHPVVTVGSSRTDAGVHAKGQVVHFDSDKSAIPLANLKRAVNARLPGDIAVRAAELVPPTFDAIKSTVRKRYQYAVWNAPERSVFGSDLYFHRWHKMKPDRMREAAAALVGEHDFSAFVRPGHGRESTVRTVFGIDVTQRGPLLVIGFEGSGFLWNQVRIMAGTLIEVGMCLREVGSVAEALASKDRRQAGRTAPPHGLYLHWIQFTDKPAHVVTLRDIRPADSMEELTALLHRAYAEWSNVGLKFLAGRQDAEMTRKRIAAGKCFIAEKDGRIVGTICVYDGTAHSQCAYYTRPGVWHFGQFGIEPDVKGTGVGSDLLRYAETYARMQGATQMALDTSENAESLLDWYKRRGYVEVGEMTWSVVNYKSKVLAKTL